VGSCNRDKEGICTKKGKGMSAIKGGEIQEFVKE